MLTTRTDLRSNFKSDNNFVIQGTIARNVWCDTKYTFQNINAAVKYAREWIADNSRWMKGADDSKDLMIVTSK